MYLSVCVPQINYIRMILNVSCMHFLPWLDTFNLLGWIVIHRAPTIYMGKSKFYHCLQSYLVLFALCKYSEKNAKIQHYLSIKSQKCHSFYQLTSSTNWSIPKSDTMLNWGSVALSGILQIFHLELDDCTLGQK